MLPAYWPMLVAGIVISVAGVVLVARADTLGRFGDWYRVIGCGWVLSGGLLIAVVFYGKPP